MSITSNLLAVVAFLVIAAGFALFLVGVIAESKPVVISETEQNPGILAYQIRKNVTLEYKQTATLFLIIGGFAIAVASRLKSIEKRLAQLENDAANRETNIAV